MNWGNDKLIEEELKEIAKLYFEGYTLEKSIEIVKEKLGRKDNGAAGVEERK
ncbi:hypothetical protein ABG79_02164 [Caloramator mitchellensis]|uniref:Uncharacterized protein n=1 Tax=Caloramator mitchellensis TaxID=908809 RepID=A0A0R3JRC9_CALMK|nr:hypothetical protein [Caloramator mitchellensis]KRQ86032.1 hypothetical protein ABG79_02164 [Caloramator mitchellensis]